MRIADKLGKPISETAYLTAENVTRYRAILRFFYLQHERIRYWLDQDEVYEEMKKYEEFAEYTPEQCRQDLNALENWKNLIAMQDTKKITSVEAFKNRKYRYQLSEYAVEIERMTIRLENLSVEGASLEPSLLERIKEQIFDMITIAGETPAKVYAWWDNLQNDFKRLNQNYQDYMKSLNSARAEELMKSTEFLIYKDNLIEYLRSFVKGLHIHAGAIESRLKNTNTSVFEEILDKIVSYEMSIPRVDVIPDQKLITENEKGRLNSLLDWFVPRNGRESEATRLFDMTNESIRKITRFATRISEQFYMGANRKEEYKKLAQMFLQCEDMNQAHCLSAMVFGVEKCLHLRGDFQRDTDSINSGVYEENGLQITIKPRIRTFGEKTKRSHIQDHSVQKEQARKAAIEKLQNEKATVASFIKDKKIVFSDLPVISEHIRNILLRWLSKALEREDGKAKTEDGKVYYISNPKEKNNCIVECEDGYFQMPAFELVFEEV